MLRSQLKSLGIVDAAVACLNECGRVYPRCVKGTAVLFEPAADDSKESVEEMRKKVRIQTLPNLVSCMLGPSNLMLL